MVGTEDSLLQRGKPLAADGLLGSDEPLDVRQGKGAVEVQFGQEGESDVADGRFGAMHPLEEALPTRRSDGVDATRGPALLRRQVRSDLTSLLQVPQRAVEVADTDRPDTPQASLKVLVQHVAVKRPRHQKAKDGTLEQLSPGQADPSIGGIHFVNIHDMRLYPRTGFCQEGDIGEERGAVAGGGGWE